MKNIIIAGPSRAGKTTLARLIHEKYGHFVISVDKLAATLCGAYPQLHIGLNRDRQTTTDNIAPFLAHFLGAFTTNNGFVNELNLRAHAIESNNFVLEGGYFNFDIIAPILKTYGIIDMRESFTLIGLAQNNKSAAQFFRDFIEYDTQDDWTYGLSDSDLMDVCHDAVSFSRAMSAHLSKHGFTIYDTSVARARVLNEIASGIVL